MKKKGFTFIEMMITVSLISVLTVVGITSYAQFNERQKLIQHAENILVRLRKMQNRAISAETSCPAGVTLLYWNMVFDTGSCPSPYSNPWSTTYGIRGSCSDGSSFGSSDRDNCVTIPPEDRTVLHIVPFTPILFYSPSGFLCPTASCTTTRTIGVKSLATNKCIDITITGRGNIDMGPIVNCAY